MTDLRPISLCSVIYKIVSKVLCARLKCFLPDIVSDTQGAFVSGRLISDNILLAHEMVHALRTNPSCDEDFIAIKTDMSKAYDRVEWNFLEELMIRLGFDIKWIQWVMWCVRSVSYSVLINGASHGFIKPERGIRQGDPLSPFLFILCAEALVHIMNKAELEGRLTGMRLTPSCPSVQHLLFADDSFFLCQATLKECEEFLRCIHLYGAASRQEINFKKSAITYGKKLDPYMRRLISSFTGIDQEGGLGKYLGLPECFSGSKREILGFITDRLNSRLSGWYEKTLSLGGKEVLLKSVAMALPVYAMSCFRLTQHQCKKITSAMTNFWWNACEDKNKMHWVSWEKICKAKKDGGLGFRDIGRFNQALLAKQAWRLLDSPSSLVARVYKAKYFAVKPFLEAKVGYRPSYAWRSILFGRELLERGLMKTIGNGQDTSVWADKWIHDDYPRRPINRELLMDLNLRVSSLITTQGDWDVSRLQQLFPREDVIQICSFPPAVNLNDRFVWAYSKDGKYSVKSGNWVLNREVAAMEIIPENIKAVNTIKEKVWDLATAPKIKLFIWRALSGALAVAECLRHHGLNTNPLCQLCRVGDETISHVLFECTLAAQVWNLTSFPSMAQGLSASVVDNIQHILNLMKDESLSSQIRNAIPWILWEIWKARNSSLYAGKQSDGHFVLASALEDAGEWLQQHHNSVQELRTEMRRCSGSIPRWIKPAVGVVKCNVHASWVNGNAFCGGAWILRNHNGDVLFHARDAFTPMFNRIAAELKCILWTLQSLHELRFQGCELWSDCSAAILAVQNPNDWPKYRSQLLKITQVIQVMREVKFILSSPKANSLAREIACSVTRDGRLRSYLALGGPSWLQDRIERDRVRGG
ncbi:Reverse transcriptase domain [Arabidopsis thaliana x Arabidopsis arenosa]|uniref:Reverse transcriptase domain n=1 Tax=Arabidopsis thaliana x Arabidopsis arenosa TaxID=1240361 RepID=A0A8T1Z266_9BRAS|nr:Reverse transcriptase domain [Arabidopsis thaliana x Arabidopsis arenosa]